MKKAIGACGVLVAFLILIVTGYLAASLVTARIEASSFQIDKTLNAGGNHKIWLVGGLLHTDIAIAATPLLLERFPYLQQSGLPLDNPALKYLTFGWGSKAFYTTAGSYSDITVSATFKAVTGDTAVMRVVGFGDFTESETTFPMVLDASQFDRLLTFIDASFAKHQNGDASAMREFSLQPGDAFFEGVGRFNIFNPCNQWVNDSLRNSGIRLGIWTPTTQSLFQSLRYFASDSHP